MRCMRDTISITLILHCALIGANIVHASYIIIDFKGISIFFAREPIECLKI